MVGLARTIVTQPDVPALVVMKGPTNVRRGDGLQPAQAHAARRRLRRRSASAPSRKTFSTSCSRRAATAPCTRRSWRLTSDSQVTLGGTMRRPRSSRRIPGTGSTRSAALSISAPTGKCRSSHEPRARKTTYSVIGRRQRPRPRARRRRSRPTSTPSHERRLIAAGHLSIGTRRQRPARPSGAQIPRTRGGDHGHGRRGDR
jgi:hypothetical protein